MTLSCKLNETKLMHQHQESYTQQHLLTFAPHESHWTAPGPSDPEVIRTGSVQMHVQSGPGTSSSNVRVSEMTSWRTWNASLKVSIEFEGKAETGLYQGCERNHDSCSSRHSSTTLKALTFIVGSSLSISIRQSLKSSNKSSSECSSLPA